MEGRKQSLKELTWQVLWLVSRQKCLGTKHCVRGRGRPRSQTTSSCTIHFCFPRRCVLSEPSHMPSSFPLSFPSSLPFTWTMLMRPGSTQTSLQGGFLEPGLGLYLRIQVPTAPLTSLGEYLSNIQNVSKEKSSTLSFMLAQVSSGSLWSGPSVKCRAGAGQY